jgi:hypothetical protein
MHRTHVLILSVLCATSSAELILHPDAIQTPTKLQNIILQWGRTGWISFPSNVMWPVKFRATGTYEGSAEEEGLRNRSMENICKQNWKQCAKIISYIFLRPTIVIKQGPQFFLNRLPVPRWWVDRGGEWISYSFGNFHSSKVEIWPTEPDLGWISRSRASLYRSDINCYRNKRTANKTRRITTRSRISKDEWRVDDGHPGPPTGERVQRRGRWRSSRIASHPWSRIQ